MRTFLHGDTEDEYVGHSYLVCAAAFGKNGFIAAVIQIVTFSFLVLRFLVR